MRVSLFSIALLTFVNLRAHSARLGGSDALRERKSTHLAGLKVSRADTKEILFFRHAESMGNLGAKSPLDYVQEVGLSAASAWKDGRVSPGGEEDTVTRIRAMDDTLLTQLLSSELVLMSPLARSMATAFIMLATACKRLDVDPSTLNDKTFVVTSDLREKVASESDVPGTNPENTGDYIARLAKKYSEMLYNNTEALNSLAGKFNASYFAERVRTENWGRGWENKVKVYAGDSETFLKQIARFREWLSTQPATRVFIVGHNGWSRWAFTPGFMAPCLDHDAEGWFHRLAFGGRDLRPLANLGLMKATFNQGIFTSFDEYRFVGGPVENCAKKTKFGLFSSTEEAKSAGLLPQDAIIQRMMLAHDGRADQTATFSATANKSWLAWGDDFAKPLAVVELSAHIAYGCDHATRRVHLAYDGEKALLPIPGYTSDMKASYLAPFHMEARTRDESLRLCNLLNIFTRFAKDTSFISKVLSEERWEKNAVYARQDVNELRGDLHKHTWDLAYEQEHGSPPSNLPAPLWLLHKATGEHGSLTDVDKYEEDGMTCTKVTWLGITWVEYC